MIRRPVLLAALLLLASCASDERSVQGPGSETSGFSARVLDAKGRPVGGVVVRAVALDRSWQELASGGRDLVLGRSVSNSDGVVRFGLVAGVARVALEVGDSVGAGRVVLDAKPGVSGELTIGTGAELSMFAQVPGETVKRVLLAGTGYEGVHNGSGLWSFADVASGWYTAVALTDSGMALLGRVELRPGMALSTSLWADVDSVLLEDFAVPPVRNRYGGLLGAGWWYTTTDSAYGGGSKVFPADPVSALVPCGDGNCLEMRFDIDSSSPANFTVLGFDLDRSYDAAGGDVRLADLSKVSSLRFDASGTGTVTVQIHYGTGAESNTCQAPIVLDSNWIRREVPLSGMTCDAKIPLDRSKAVGVTFLAQSDLSLRLGRIVLAGAGPRSVFPDLKPGGSP